MADFLFVNAARKNSNGVQRVFELPVIAVHFLSLSAINVVNDLQNELHLLSK